ncbi:MAG: hypothetical protein IPP43_06700 [Chitinophagaceae bacterium]|nr:hypothetical protein [Chitinophagaceae bacterium]
MRPGHKAVAYQIKETGVCHTFEPNKNNSDLIIEALNSMANFTDFNNLSFFKPLTRNYFEKRKFSLASTVTATVAFRM